MKKLFTLFAAAAIAATAMAIPARREYITVTNSDGKTLSITLCGDETFHYYKTSDGLIVRKSANGDWVPDTRDVSQLWTASSAKRNKHRSKISQRLRSKAPLRAGESVGVAGTKKGLLILVNFKDVKFTNTVDRTKEIYNQMLNSLGNPYGQNYGSVREYFKAQSYGALDIEFDIVGPVQVSGNMATYGANDDEGYDIGAAKMVAEAVKLADSQVNFKDYDWDGDGEVENIYITYAGFGEAVSGADENTIWPHQWVLSESEYGSSIKADGVTVDTYACGSELQGVRGKVIDGIGTMCHEYSHCLGLPDFYDTRDVKTTNFGMSSWSIMDYGCYNDDGFCPAGYTAYERWFSGWLEPIELSEGTIVSDMPDIETHPVAYVVYNDANRNEYYLLENHQKVEWDKEAYGHGMLIVHVDYDQNAWYNNEVNNTTSRQRMTIIPADGKCSDENLSSDPFPGTGRVTALTDESTPAATLYRANTDGKKFMHKPIEDISEKLGTISFTFMGGNSSIAAPEVESEVSNLEVTKNGFTAKWNAVENAVSYNLLLTEVADASETSDEVLEAITMYEDFDKFYVDETKTSDGTSDISNNLNDYTIDMNWAGSAVYQGVYGAKLGSGSKIGYLTTPMCENHSGELTIFLEAWDWFNFSTYSNTGTYKTDGSSVEVSLLDADENVISSQVLEVGDLSNDDVVMPCIHFSNVPSTYYVKISTVAMKKRLYVTYLVIFDGNFTDEEVDSIFVYEDEDSEEYDEYDFSVKSRSQLNNSRHMNKVPARVDAEVQTLTGLTGTSYTFTDLTPGKKYTWQVQAVGEDGSLSRWSQQVTLTLPDEDETAVSQTKAVPSRQQVYDLSGRKLNIPSSQLSHGVYVIDGQKVVIK